MALKTYIAQLSPQAQAEGVSEDFYFLRHLNQASKGDSISLAIIQNVRAAANAASDTSAVIEFDGMISNAISDNAPVVGTRVKETVVVTQRMIDNQTIPLSRQALPRSLSLYLNPTPFTLPVTKIEPTQFNCQTGGTYPLRIKTRADVAGDLNEKFEVIQGVFDSFLLWFNNGTGSYATVYAAAHIKPFEVQGLIPIEVVYVNGDSALVIAQKMSQSIKNQVPRLLGCDQPEFNLTSAGGTAVSSTVNIFPFDTRHTTLNSYPAWSSLTAYTVNSTTSHNVNYAGGWYRSLITSTNAQPNISPLSWQLMGPDESYLYIYPVDVLNSIETSDVIDSYYGAGGTGFEKTYLTVPEKNSLIVFRRQSNLATTKTTGTSVAGSNFVDVSMVLLQFQYTVGQLFSGPGILPGTTIANVNPLIANQSGTRTNLSNVITGLTDTANVQPGCIISSVGAAGIVTQRVTFVTPTSVTLQSQFPFAGESSASNAGVGTATFSLRKRLVQLSQPALSEWSNVTAYVFGNYVSYLGVVYAAKVANTGFQPDISTTQWLSLATTPATWSISTAYIAGDAVTFSGIKYLAIVANTGFVPNTNTLYWLALGAVTLPGAGTFTATGSTPLVVGDQLQFEYEIDDFNANTVLQSIVCNAGGPPSNGIDNSFLDTTTTTMPVYYRVGGNLKSNRIVIMTGGSVEDAQSRVAFLTRLLDLDSKIYALNHLGGPGSPNTITDTYPTGIGSATTVTAGTTFGPITNDSRTRSLVSFIEQIRPNSSTKVHLVSFSNTGQFALETARWRPDLVQSVTCCDPQIFGNSLQFITDFAAYWNATNANPLLRPDIPSFTSPYHTTNLDVTALLAPQITLQNLRKDIWEGTGVGAAGAYVGLTQAQRAALIPTGESATTPLLIQNNGSFPQHPMWRAYHTRASELKEMIPHPSGVQLQANTVPHLFVSGTSFLGLWELTIPALRHYLPNSTFVKRIGHPTPESSFPEILKHINDNS